MTGETVTKTREENPWLGIPAREYEGHMAEIGQSAALRDIFLGVYTDTNPRRLLMLGCTTGKDLELVDPNVTEKSVGVDVNREYLEIARKELDRLGRTVDLVHGDVLDAQLPSSEFDLIHAALLVEYVDPSSLFRRIAEWLAMDGVCSTVTQNPAEGVASVSKTAYDSLLVLDGRMCLCSPDQLNSFAVQAGLLRMSNCDVQLPLGKSFSVSTFRKATSA
jgi:SAM-dependent methyltransferase